MSFHSITANGTGISDSTPIYSQYIQFILSKQAHHNWSNGRSGACDVFRKVCSFMSVSLLACSHVATHLHC